MTLYNCICVLYDIALMVVFLYFIDVDRVDRSLAKMKYAIQEVTGTYDLVASSIFCYNILFQRGKHIRSAVTAPTLNCL